MKNFICLNVQNLENFGRLSFSLITNNLDNESEKSGKFH